MLLFRYNIENDSNLLVATTGVSNSLRGVAKGTKLQVLSAVRLNIRMPCRSDVV